MAKVATSIQKILADSIISQGKGNVKFYGADGGIQTCKRREVSIFDNQEELEQAIELESMQEVGDVAITDGEGPTNSDEQEADEPSAAPAPTKRGKGKAKEKSQVATKKKAGKKAAKKTTANGSMIRSIAGREHDISNYQKVKNASGHTSYDNGDDVATKLREKTLDEVYGLAAKKLGETEKELRAKYKHLNPGMQRMTLGNRMRAGTKAAA